MISWLDEEHRRDKQQLTEIRQKADSQAIELQDQSKRIQELEARLAATQAKLTRFNTLEQAIQNVRDELVLMVRAQEEEREQFQKEQVKGRHLDQESISRALNELRRSLEVIPPIREKLTTLKAEDQRLGELTLNMQTRITAHERRTAQLPDRITYVEGQRAQDVKAVAKAQEEIAELIRRTEALAARAEIVDDISRKNEQRITVLRTLREDLLKRQAEMAEDLRLKQAQRDRQMQDWDTMLQHFEEEIGKQRKLFEKYTQQQDEVHQYLVAIEGYKEALNREQKQVAELQRMGEERQRRELEEWIAANEQQWTRFRLEREAQWHQQSSRNEEVINRLKQLEQFREEDLNRTHQLHKQLLEMHLEYRRKMKELWRVHERVAIFSLDEARRWYDEISHIVTERAGDD
jgi:hypothetical protein